MMGRYQGWMAGLVLTGVALCVMIWMEVGLYRQEARADLVPLGLAASRVEATVGIEPAGERDLWFNEIVSRPLFNPDRRPVANQDGGDTSLPRLTAIIVDGPRRIAVFEALAGGHARVVEVGSRIGVYDVRNIADGGITVAGPEGTVVIRPTFHSAPQEAWSDAVAQPVAQFEAAAPAVHRAALPAHPAFFNVTVR